MLPRRPLLALPVLWQSCRSLLLGWSPSALLPLSLLTEQQKVLAS